MQSSESRLALTGKQKLALIAWTGTKVNEDGRIIDGEGFPVMKDPTAQAQQHRMPFDEKDNRTLAGWLARAAVEGISLKGPRIFKDMQRTTLRHTWQSWQKYWRQDFQDNMPNYNTVTSGSDRQDFLRQIESNNDRSSIPPSHHDGDPDHLPARSPFALETSFPSNLSAPHTDGVVASSEAESSANPITVPRLSPLNDRAPVEDPALTKAPPSSEEALRKLLHLRDRDEMATWLSQDWVADAFIEYYDRAIDHWRREMEEIEAIGGEIPPQERRSQGKFLVCRAADALRSRNPRYVSASIPESYWTKDDQDIRFLVRMVDAGRAAGRCWERYTRGDHTEYLCTVAYRLKCWLRAMHKITLATSGMSRWKKANCDQWFNILRRIREQRAGFRGAPLPPLTDSGIEASDVETPQHHDPSHTQTPSPPPSHTSKGDLVGMRLLPARSPGELYKRSDIDLNATSTFSSDLTYDSTTLADGNSSRDSSDSLEEVRSKQRPSGAVLDDDPGADARSVRHLNEREGQDLIAADFTSLDTSPERKPDASSIEQAVPLAVPSHLATPAQLAPNFEYPTFADYPAVRSKSGMNQMKAIEWMLETGKARFEAHQDQLLARWGLTAEHTGTCVLIPASWSQLDPQDLVDDFSYEMQPSGGIATRLMFSMSDHATPWARAAAWFDPRSWPRTGAAFDGFLSIGPYRPKDGSHLCHQGNCINQHHLVYEDSGLNGSRGRCSSGAQDMRLLRMDVPKHCPHHDPPCLLQNAALTHFESYLIQFSIFRRAKGLPSIRAPVPPPDHSFPTFEYQLPLSFTSSSIDVNPTHLVSFGSQPVMPSTRTPTLRCRFCTKVAAYKRVTALWCHIRDKHTLIDTQTRLQEIVRTGSLWRDHWERERALGFPVNPNDPTWIKLEQMKEPDFGWGVVLNWKIVYSAAKERLD